MSEEAIVPLSQRLCPHGVAVSPETCRLCRPKVQISWGLVFAGLALLTFGTLLVAGVVPKDIRGFAWFLFLSLSFTYLSAIGHKGKERRDELAAWRLRTSPCPHGVPMARVTPSLCPDCAAAFEAARVAAETQKAQKLKEARERERDYVRRSNSLEALRAMEPMEFQDFMWLVYRRLGYEVTETPAGSDGGVDGFLVKDGKTFLLQCKRYRGDVGEPMLRDLFGTKVHHRAHGAILVTTGRVSPKARDFCKGKGIVLVDHADLPALVDAAELSEIGNSAPPPSQGNCPQCGAALRIVRLRDGKSFIGCTGYPTCRYHRSIARRRR